MCFTDQTYKDIIKDVYALEKEGDTYSGKSRTFQLKNGFHSCNILKPEILEKFPMISLCVNRIQEILYNQFAAGKIDFRKDPDVFLQINELWVNILRKGDYNMPHNHPQTHIAGNFYLQVPEIKASEKTSEADGMLLFIPAENNTQYLPDCVGSTERMTTLIRPTRGKGVLFQGHERHVVLPHFSSQDRIGIAFNSTVVRGCGYQSIVPVPYWMPCRLTYRCDSKNGDRVDDHDLILNLRNGKEIKINRRRAKLQEGADIDGKLFKVGVDMIGSFADPKYYQPGILKHFVDGGEDYLRNSKPNWDESAEVYFEDNNAKNLLIIFAGFGSGEKPAFIFVKSLQKYENWDKLYIRDFSRTWYLQTSAQLGGNFDSLCSNVIMQYILPRHSVVSTLGCSAGGYAAILAAYKIHAVSCFAMAPQTVLDHESRLRMKDKRWEAGSKSISVKLSGSEYLDLANVCRDWDQMKSPTKVNIYVSTPADKIQGDHLSGILSNVTTTSITSSQKAIDPHFTALILKKAGVLNHHLEKVLNLN